MGLFDCGNRNADPSVINQTGRRPRKVGSPEVETVGSNNFEVPFVFGGGTFEAAELPRRHPIIGESVQKVEGDHTKS